MLNFSRYRLPFFFAVVAFLVAGTVVMVKIARGYRFDLSVKGFRPTGLLAITSDPAGVEIWLDGELKTATNATLSLPPDSYDLTLKKTGFWPWRKKVLIEKELVTQIHTVLFPQIPDLKPITLDEIVSPQASPDGTKIVYAIPQPNPRAGLWVMDLADFIFGLGRGPRQVIASTLSRDFSQADYSWSPDSRQVIVKSDLPAAIYLLDPGRLHSLAELKDVSGEIDQYQEQWQKEESLKLALRLKKLPASAASVLATQSANLAFNQDNTKILYQATASAVLAAELIPPVPAASSQKQARQLDPGNWYVYDLKEDRNFLVPHPSSSPLPAPTWYPTGRHLLWLGSQNEVVIAEYDGLNPVVAYSGPLIPPYVFVVPSADRLIILSQTNIDGSNKPNLYSVSLK